MEITARQLGRIEAACYALAKLTERNDVGTVLVNTIREQLDEIEQTADPYEMPEPGRDAFDRTRFCPDPQVTREEIRSFGRKMLDRGEGLIPTLRAISSCYDLPNSRLARLLGCSRTAVSLAFNDRKVRQILLARCAEFFGTDGGAPDLFKEEA